MKLLCLLVSLTLTVAIHVAGQDTTCLTQSVFESHLLQYYGRIGPDPVMCRNGDCDRPAPRNAAIPDSTTLVRNVRVFIQILRDDSGSNPTTTAAFVDSQIARTNQHYADYRFHFCYRYRFVNSSVFRTAALALHDSLKATLAISPSRDLNIYVVNYDGRSYAIFPWDPLDPQSAIGGIIANAPNFFPNYSVVMTHEIGHCLGLWHVFHGTKNEDQQEIPLCDEQCWERADLIGADTTGDDCSDTPPAILTKDCITEGGYDGCSQMPWDTGAPKNYMGYSYVNGGDTCMNEFTPQQAGRMHCWFNSVLSSWEGTQFSFRVPEDFPTIQAAIDVCQSGDTITVGPGTYAGAGNTNVDFQGKAIILRSSAGATATTINCSDAARAILCTTGENVGSRIVGFTIKDGYSSGNGGAVYLNNVSATFDSCIFLSCRAQEGGAVYADGSTSAVTFSGCVFDTNTTTVVGGAIVAYGSLTLNHCTFVKNNCTGNRPAVVTLSSTNNYFSIVNTLIARNQTYAIDCQSTGGTRTFTCNDFWQNGSGPFNPSSNCQAGSLDTTNIALDPKYCDYPGRVYTVDQFSPCATLTRPAGCSSYIGVYDAACGAPVLVAPADSGVMTARHPTLDWADIDPGMMQSVKYDVQVDDDVVFGSIDRSSSNLSNSSWQVSPDLTLGIWYWRARASAQKTSDPASRVWGFWATSRSFTIVDGGGGGTSCPILFTYDGEKYHKENPLLTACENFGYQQAVTDYYHVVKPVAAEDGQIRFQLREMDDEISYFNSLALMTVDHDATTKVACGVDGEITLYREAISPLAVTDQNGIDWLNQVRAKDGVTFSAEGPGYLEVTFSNRPGDIVVNPTGKQFCQEGADSSGIGDKVAVGSPSNPQLRVEVRDSLGQWVTLGDIPPREQLNQELIGGVYPVRADAPVVVFRITWSQKYSADVIQQIIPLSEVPAANQWTVSTADMSFKDGAAKPVSFLSALEPVVLNKGDILDFSFACGEPPSGQARDYIIVANGRYEPMSLASAIPTSFELEQNYPNPFNPSTTISFNLPVASQVKLAIYNSAGQTVRTLIEERMIAGRKAIVWDGADSKGRRVASGAYFYKIEAGEYSSTRKMILLK